MERSLMKGNEALAEAAIRAGCKCFFGYPITPQTELSAYMAKRMEKSGGVFLQAESEIAAINMVLGAASTGVRAMTSSSSPGVSLKAEGISYMAGSDLPGLIINVQRGGPGLGSIQPAQSDYNQATHAMGHGDFHILVYAPCSVQEMVDTVTLAFDKADQYRMPAMILADGLLGAGNISGTPYHAAGQVRLGCKRSRQQAGTPYHQLSVSGRTAAGGKGTGTVQALRHY